MSKLTRIALLSAASLSCFVPCFGQTDIPHFGAAVTASTLGAGIQVATGVTQSANIRAGFNIFNYDDTFSKDGISYKGDLHLRSVQATWDQYFRGFHISPGLLIYDGNRGGANATVPGGQSFTLNGTAFYSSTANPVNGAGSVTFNKAAPMLLIGYGNLLPRSGRHLTFNIEAGVVYQGPPNTQLNLGGATCFDSAQRNCVSTASNTIVQSNVQAEQARLNHDFTLLRWYPIVSIGFGYKF